MSVTVVDKTVVHQYHPAGRVYLTHNSHLDDIKHIILFIQRKILFFTHKPSLLSLICNNQVLLAFS